MTDRGIFTPIRRWRQRNELAAILVRGMHDINRTVEFVQSLSDSRSQETLDYVDDVYDLQDEIHQLVKELIPR